MRTTSYLSGLVLVSAFLGAGCNLSIDGNPIQGLPGQAGNAGSGQAGEAGQAGAGGYAGSGQAGEAGQAGQAGEAGQAGAGGLAGQAGAGGGISAPEKFVLTGGDVVEEFELFPFSVAIGPDGAIFVSTLGNRSNEPSRIYRFNPGTTSNPEVLFEVGNAEDAAVYGLAFNTSGTLHACVSQHLDSPNNNIVASLLHFDPAQLGQSFLGPANVANTQLRTTAVNVDGNFIVSDAVSAGRCGQIAADDNFGVFAPDVSGESGYVFRFNLLGSQAAPSGNLGDPLSSEELAGLSLSLLAWSSQPQFGPGNTFGVTGVAASANGVHFVREDDATSVFHLGLADGFLPLDEVEVLASVYPLSSPFGLAAFSSETLVVSSRDADELALLFPQDGAFIGGPILDANTDASFRQPAGIAIRGDEVVVAASQIDLLGSSAAEPFKLFSLRLSGF